MKIFIFINQAAVMTAGSCSQDLHQLTAPCRWLEGCACCSCKFAADGVFESSTCHQFEVAQGNWAHTILAIDDLTLFRQAHVAVN